MHCLSPEPIRLFLRMEANHIFVLAARVSSEQNPHSSDLWLGYAACKNARSLSKVLKIGQAFACVKAVWERVMKIFTSLFFLVSLAGSAWAGAANGGLGVGGNTGITPPAAPGPEMTAGLIGMTLAAGAIYLIKRRKGS